MRTYGGRSAGVEGVVTEAAEHGGLPHAGVSHQDDFKEAVGGRGSALLLGKKAGSGESHFKLTTKFCRMK